MSFLKQIIYSIARTFGRFIAYAIIGALLALLASNFVRAESYYLTVEDNDTSYISETVSSFPRTYTRNPGCSLGFPCISSPSVRFTLLENLTTANMYDFKGTIELYFYGYLDYTYNTTGISCFYRQTSETLPCNASVSFAKQNWSDISGQDMWKLTVNYNLTNINPSTSRSGIQIYIPPLSQAIYAWKINVEQPTYRSQIADNTDILTSSFESVGQGIENSVNQSTTDIINNQNDNTTQVIEALNNQNKVCNEITIIGNNRIGREDFALGVNNNEVLANNYYITDYIPITKNQTYILSGAGISGNANSYCLYDENNNYNCTAYNGANNFTINSENYTRIRWTIVGNGLTTLVGTFCYDYREKETEESEKQTNLLVQIGQGIIGLPDSIGNVFSDLLTYLFVPDDFDFSDEILEPLEEKLGFIAEIPISIITWLINLPNVNYDEFTGFTFPSFSFKDYTFWESQQIDITEIRDTIAPYKFYTSLTCVVICINTLYRHYHNFANGGE